MPFNVIGVDIAVRNSGVSVYNTELKKFTYFGVHSYKPKFDYQYNSLMSFKTTLYSYMESTVFPTTDPRLPFLFVVEGITRKGHFHTTIKIMLARSFMFNYIHDKESTDTGFMLYDVMSPTVQDWKKELLGKGNANKAETETWLLDMRTTYSIPLPVYESDDIVDATSLVILGLRRLGVT